MAIEFYSHSKLSTFEQCKMKYKFRYIDKIIPEVEKSIEAHLGSSVHSALEWFYQQVKSKEFDGFPEIDELIEKYARIWKENFSSDMIIVKPGRTHEDYFNRGMHFLLDYYLENKPFDDNTIDIEKKIYINLDENTRLIGFIDRLVHDIENNTLEIHDYKTSESQPRHDHGEQDRQLALYSIAIKESFGKEKDVKLIWHFLAHNKKVKSKRTNAELDKLKQETLNLIKEIRQTTHFPPTKSRLCDWCEYKNICPAWGNSPINAKRRR